MKGLLLAIVTALVLSVVAGYIVLTFGVLIFFPLLIAPGIASGVILGKYRLPVSSAAWATIIMIVLGLIMLYYEFTIADSYDSESMMPLFVIWPMIGIINFFGMLIGRKLIKR